MSPLERCPACNGPIIKLEGAMREITRRLSDLNARTRFLHEISECLPWWFPQRKIRGRISELRAEMRGLESVGRILQ